MVRVSDIWEYKTCVVLTCLVVWCVRWRMIRKLRHRPHVVQVRPKCTIWMKCSVSCWSVIYRRYDYNILGWPYPFELENARVNSILDLLFGRRFLVSRWRHIMCGVGNVFVTKCCDAGHAKKTILTAERQTFRRCECVFLCKMNVSLLLEPIKVCCAP